MKIEEFHTNKMDYDELVQARALIDQRIEQLRAEAADRYGLALPGSARVPRKRKSTNGPHATDEAAS